MMLEVGEYEIPEDCTAKVYKGVVYVAPKLPGGRRVGTKKHEVKYCRDCRHRIRGYANRQSRTMVCKLRPKAIMNRRIYGEKAKYGWEFRGVKFYYAASEHAPICKNFREKKKRNG